VISAIDSNKSGLHVEDAKFFSLILNPSEKEAAKLGGTREKKMRSLGIMVDRMMDRYAEGFNKEGVKTHQDLLYFYTIHEYRENDDGSLRPGIHVHIIVSRKDNTGKYKLSPMTNHRGESSGVIKSGFNRDSFYRDCERIFDTTFGYQRRISESYDYNNTMTHGSNEERAAMIHASVQEERIREQVTAALARRAARLAQEAATEEAKRKRQAELARQNEEKKKRNEFWNSYHSYYRPALDELKKQCNTAFSLYDNIKVERAGLWEETSEQYRKLKFTYDLLLAKQKELRRARTYKELLRIFTKMMFFVNPLPVLIASLALQVLLEGKKLYDREKVQALRNQVDDIREEIESLKTKQDKLKHAQHDSLRQYIEVKDKKAELTQQIQALKKELEQPRVEIDLDSVAKELSKRKTAQKESSMSQVYAAFGIYGAMMSAETKVDLELDLLSRNNFIEPILHPNGGVADFNLIVDGNTLLASRAYSDEKLAAMLEKWCGLTGQKPAHRLANKVEDDDTVKSFSTYQEQKIENYSYGKQRTR
ncbi:MAG: hypothetical protein J6N80_05015, partial [Bacteroidales bacterium]|nr:hypothetical protein [Bacteroidales bacterium]